jgi:hypothetical protein
MIKPLAQVYVLVVQVLRILEDYAVGNNQNQQGPNFWTDIIFINKFK